MKFVILVFAALSLVGLYTLKTNAPRPASPVLPAVSPSLTPLPTITPPPPLTLNLPPNSPGSFQVLLNARGVTLSAVAFRLIRQFPAAPDIKFTDADAKKAGTQIAVSQSLLDAGWVFPVNSVTTDPAKRQMIVDLAAVNLTPEGYTPDSLQTLVTLNFTATSALDNATFEFDPQITKIFTKRGDELTLTSVPNLLLLQ